MDWFLYHHVMGASDYSSLLVLLKQSVNGVFNTLIASIVLCFTPIHGWLRMPEPRKRVSIEQALFHVILAMVLVPSLAIMIISSRKAFSDIETRITQKLQNTTVQATYLTRSFIRRYEDGVNALADVAAREGVVPSASLQAKLRSIKGYYPYFQGMYVADAAGVSVAFYPEKNQQGTSTIGLDFSDRPYYRKLKATLRPVMSDVFMARATAVRPIVTFSVPILAGDRFIGFAQGGIDLSRLRRELARFTDAWGVRATILDAKDRVIATTNEAFRPMQLMDWRKSGELRPSHAGIYNWLPPVHASKSAFDRWKNSFYALETPVGDDVPWKVLLAVPVAPYQKQLYQTTYIDNFSFMLLIVAASMFLSAFLSRKLVRPIERLKEVTTDLPSRLALRKTIEWPDASLSEIHSLVGNFKAMTASLMQKFLELNTANQSLEQRSSDLLTVNKALQQEIANHKRTEECLAGEKERLSVTLLSIGDGVISADTGGKVVLINKVAENLLGWTQREAVGRLLTDIFVSFDVHDRQRPIDPQRDCTAGEGGRVVLDRVLLVSRDGSEYDVSTCFAPIRDPRGSTVGGVLVFRDNTERRKIEERLQNAQKLESIGVLAGGIAHDFNNYLSAILGHTSLARMQGSGPVLEQLEAIEKASWRAKDLTQQLLTFSKGGAPVKKTVSIVGLIRRAATFVTRGSGVRCEFRFAPDLRPVDADEGQLSQVVHNLVINAVQAMPDGGLIRISAENVAADATLSQTGLSGDLVRVSVRDEGKGIRPEDVSRIFDPFFTTREQRSGLGLSTAYSIIRQHGGRIEVESDRGSGTAFHLYLSASERPLSDGEPAPATPRAGRGTILVMDDEDYIRKLVETMLKHLGYGVRCARDGAEAVAFYREAMEAGEPFDAVIMDLTVPGGMGGKEAIRLLKELDPAVTAIVSSGYSNDPILAEPDKFGFAAVVAKPYTLPVLSDAIARIVAAKPGNNTRAT